ncbi:TAXI family TRAP transporter solute-binding subunit [Sediminibacillus dalangtanensis]|uniref:TAXI family TRAP transporter solute-binding subunit n=1 Tax=Sediminibacillus dalangtanensis TaxID=2729421 RepID=A0ABX7VXE3_9BACI|nr:TAXI family TRAP transporter solute-binding subunit [Sediminibacillus dalangtanensis]QTN01209.1 TAXI family TRAP transporter solute-binding subunit [Sediminibacillus dalangtanensis]
MEKKKWLLILVLTFALSMLLAACGGGEADPDSGGDSGEGDSADSGETQFLSVLTGGTEGTYYPLGGTFAQIINDNLDNAEANAQSTGASVENMKTMRDGDAELAFTQTDIAAYAAEGSVMFEGDQIDNIQAIGTLYPETIQIVTTADSGIETVADLEGKVVSVGAPGSGTNASATDILEVYGLSMDDIEARDLDFGDSTSGIQDGTIDAAFITSGTPTGAVESLAATTDVNIVRFDEEKIQELIDAHPYYAEDTIKEGTYDLEEDVKTVAVQAMLVTSADLSEDLVYDVTKAIFENTDQISHPKGEFISADTALDGVGIDLHPGAKKYFDEKGIEQ